MSTKEKLSIVCPADLAERIRQHQRRLTERLGTRVSLSQTAASLLNRALEREGGR